MSGIIKRGYKEEKIAESKDGNVTMYRIVKDDGYYMRRIIVVLILLAIASHFVKVRVYTGEEAEELEQFINKTTDQF